MPRDVVQILGVGSFVRRDPPRIIVGSTRRRQLLRPHPTSVSPRRGPPRPCAPAPRARKEAASSVARARPRRRLSSTRKSSRVTPRIGPSTRRLHWFRSQTPSRWPNPSRPRRSSTSGTNASVPAEARDAAMCPSESDASTEASPEAERPEVLELGARRRRRGARRDARGRSRAFASRDAAQLLSRFRTSSPETSHHAPRRVPGTPSWPRTRRPRRVAAQRSRPPARPRARGCRGWPQSRRNAAAATRGASGGRFVSPTLRFPPPSRRQQISRRSTPRRARARRAGPGTLASSTPRDTRWRLGCGTARVGVSPARLRTRGGRRRDKRLLVRFLRSRHPAFPSPRLRARRIDRPPVAAVARSRRPSGTPRTPSRERVLHCLRRLSAIPPHHASPARNARAAITPFPRPFSADTTTGAFRSATSDSK